MENQTEDIKKLVKDEKVVFGTEKTVTMLKQGRIKQVFTTSNCPKDIKSDIDHYAKIADVKVTELSIPNDELGVICRKPFVISVLGVRK